MEAAVAAVVGLAFDTVGDPAAGPALAAAIARMSNAHSFHLQVHAPQGMRMIAVYNTDAIIEKGYADHYWRIDEWAARYPVGGREILESESFITDSAFRRSEIYNDLLRRNGDLVGCAGGVFPIGAHEKLVVGAHRSRNQASFSPDTLRRLNALLPLFEHVVKARRRGEAERARLAEAVLDLQPNPTLIVDAACGLQFANRAARDALAQGRPLTRIGARVALSGPDAPRFARAAEGACSGRGGSIVHVTDRRAGVASVAVDPLPGEPGLAAVRWRDEEARLAEEVAGARAAMALTAAEALVAESLLRGLSPAQHALTRGVSINTVRSQMRTLFGKAGVSRQAELVAMLKTGAARSHAEPCVSYPPKLDW